MKPLLAIVGPTAAGKTAAGLELARSRGGEIVSVDSRQIYRLLNVGTAKPAGAWRGDLYISGSVPYHLVDFLEPSEIFSAADFCRLAQTKIDEIRAREKLPILVGGTGFYFRALLEGLAPLPPANEALREELREWAASEGRARLHEELARVDPPAAAKIPANNIQRLIRALEVYRLTGKPISEWHNEHQGRRSAVKNDEGPPPEIIGIDPGKDELQRRIVERCRGMLDEGMIEETERALALGYRPESPGLSGLGYPRVVSFLKNRISKDELLQLLIQDTRQYAKRQRTWFRNQMEVTWKSMIGP